MRGLLRIRMMDEKAADMGGKLASISDEFNSTFKERYEEIAGSLLAMISGEHVLFIGPPGTAKSLLARDLCKCIEGGSFFYYLLTRFTTPEEIFGPLSLASLEKDTFSRKTEGYLPSANISFLDEIFKANSSILNSLLTVLNERCFHNGCEVVKVPLLAVFGASNELPEENESLDALYDRFLFRYYVKYIQDESNFRSVILGNAEGFDPSAKIGLEELEAIRTAASKVELEEEVINAILRLRREFQAQGIHVSDRRWKKVAGVLKIGAAALGRESVDVTMLPIIQHMTWDKPEELNAIRQLLINIAGMAGINLEAMKKDIEDLHQLVKDSKDRKLDGTIECRNCLIWFNNWRTLRDHALESPNHTYVVKGENQPYQLVSWRANPHHLPNLIEQFKERGWGTEIALSEQNRKLFLKEVQGLKDQLARKEGDLTLEWDRMKGLVRSNIWISEKDKKDILEKWGEKFRALDAMRELISETEMEIGKEETMLV